MYESAFKNIDNSLREDSGCSTELDYIEQTSWILFLKYLDDYEAEKEQYAILNGEIHNSILEKKYRWNSWAVSSKKNNNIDDESFETGDDLKDFVNKELFPYLKKFKFSAESPNTLKYKIGEIFGEITNKFQSGYRLRDVIDEVDKLSFLTNENKNELSSLYEDKIKRMGNAGRNGGEYYTPRPLIQSIIKVINPKIGETIYDGAVGSAGFLCEAYSFMRHSKELNASEFQQLQKRTFFGKEKKSLSYVIGIMNMILHGIEAPNIVHTNTLNQKIGDIQDKDKVDIVLANPPFGGNERKAVQQHFPIETSETAYLFLQHFIKILKADGRCGVVIKNTFLSNIDNASVELRKQLLSECNLFAVLDLPKGVFSGTGSETVVLFFEKGKSTKNIWFYQLNVGRNIGKTKPLNESDMADFINLQKEKQISENSWIVDISKINKDNWDLTINNPNKKKKEENFDPYEIIQEIENLELETAKTIKEIKALIK